MRIWKARFSRSEVWDLRILDLRKILQSKNFECKVQRFRVERCKVLQFRIRSVLELRDEESIDEDQRDYDSRVEDSKLKIWIASVQHPKLEVSAKFRDSSVQDSRVQSPRQRD